MAAGDPVEHLSNVTGGGSTTVSVPSGETWVISSYTAIGTSGTGRLGRTDGTITGDQIAGKGAGGQLTERPVFDGHDPVLENGDCNSKAMGLSGREI